MAASRKIQGADARVQAEWLIENAITSRLAYIIAVDGVASALVLSMAANRGAEFAVFSLAPDPFLTFGDEPKSREDALSVHRAS